MSRARGMGLFLSPIDVDNSDAFGTLSASFGCTLFMTHLILTAE